MILAVALLTQGLSAFALKVDRGGIEEEEVHTREKITVALEELLFDHILDAAGSKGRPVFLILCLFSQKGHGAIQVMQSKRFNPVDAVIPAPLIAGAIGPGNEQAMQNCQEDGPLHIELELPTLQQATDNLVDAQLLPKPFKDDGRTDLLCRSPDISVAAADYQVPRVARYRGLSEEQVNALVSRFTEGRQLGILGEPRVNVLQLNLALDEVK